MHHSSPSAITYPSSPSPTTDLTAPRPTPALLHPALLPSILPHDLPLPYSTQPYTHLTDLPPAPALLTALRPAHDLPHYSAIYPRSAYPTYVHTAPYPLLRSHPLHILLPSRTHVPLSTPPSPSPPQMYHATSISYRLYHTALPRTPLSSI